MRLHFRRDFHFAFKPLALDAFVQQRLDVGRHVVEGFGQFAELVARADADAMREIAALDKLGRAIETMDSARHGARHPESSKERQQFEHEKSQADILECLPPERAGFAAAQKLLARDGPRPIEEEGKVRSGLAAEPVG